MGYVRTCLLFGISLYVRVCVREVQWQCMAVGPAAANSFYGSRSLLAGGAKPSAGAATYLLMQCR